ncbi:MAG: hypothetical protein ACOYI4_03745 [Christensenellales bacterium]|jgi:hypothetical protein
MIIHKFTKQIQTQSHRPNENWMGEDWVLVPETEENPEETAEPRTVPINQELIAKIVANAPYMEFVLDKDGQLVDVTPTERPQEEQGVDEITQLQLAVAELATLMGGA